MTPAPRLDLGRVAYFPQAPVRASASGVLTIRNVGAPPPAENLKLGLPHWEVTAIAGNVNEFCIGDFDEPTNTCLNTVNGYDAAVGLVADGMTEFKVPVRITPDGLGLRWFTVTIFSNDPDEPTTVINIIVDSVMLPPCDVDVTPVALDFGALTPPASTELVFSLRNQLTGPNDVCMVSNFRLLSQSSVFSLVDAPPANFDLMPGEARQVRVRATWNVQPPSVPSIVTGSVAFTVADPIAPQLSLPLSATLAPSCLTLIPSSLDFRTVAQGCSSPARTIQVLNHCPWEAVIGPSSMRPSGEFVTVNGISAGTRVGPGSMATVSIAYRPTNLGPDHGSFALSVGQGMADGGMLPLDYVVPLAGEANTDGRNVDELQLNSGKTDVLMVIDNSGSMADKQLALATHMPALLQYATINAVDFQIGVIDTETNSSLLGVMHKTQRGTKILRPATPNLSTEFAELVNVGTSGASESCLEPALWALSEPNLSTNNAGFLRDDASLAIMCFTDANDQSWYPPAYYLDRFLAVRPRARFNYNVMGPFLPMPPPGCSYDTPGSDGRHEFMVTNSGGVQEEICTTDWPTALGRLGASAFMNVGNGGTIYLEARPDLSGPAGLMVKVNGQAIPEFSPAPTSARLWSYDVTGNKVTFDSTALPPPNATISVSYVVACVP